MSEELVTAVAEAQEELERAARTHKRSAAAHRRSAQGVMKALDRFKAACDGIGIKVVTEYDDTDRGGQSHDESAREDDAGT